MATLVYTVYSKSQHCLIGRDGSGKFILCLDLNNILLVFSELQFLTDQHASYIKIMGSPSLIKIDCAWLTSLKAGHAFTAGTTYQAATSFTLGLFFRDGAVNFSETILPVSYRNTLDRVSFYSRFLPQVQPLLNFFLAEINYPPLFACRGELFIIKVIHDRTGNLMAFPNRINHKKCCPAADITGCKYPFQAGHHLGICLDSRRGVADNLFIVRQKAEIRFLADSPDDQITRDQVFSARQFGKLSLAIDNFTHIRFQALDSCNLIFIEDDFLEDAIANDLNAFFFSFLDFIE